MRNFIKNLAVCSILIIIVSCTATKELTISAVAPSPVDFSKQIRKIGIVNSSKSSFVKGYTTRVEQLIVLEEKWLAEKGTEAALTGLFDELAQDERFDTVRILDNIKHEIIDFGTEPSDTAWKKIAAICKTNGVDAIFSLASHDTQTQYSLKNTKMDKLDMMRDRNRVTGQEITLETLIENGWRIYDPYQRVVVDEFTSNEQIVASAKGEGALDAMQAIDDRRETLLAQSKSSGSLYGQRMQPQKIDIQRAYYSSGTRNFTLADAKIQDGDYDQVITLWKEETTHPKPRISGRACYNLAVLSEFNGNLSEALDWAAKSYKLHNEEETLSYIRALELRQTQADVLQSQFANTTFED